METRVSLDNIRIVLVRPTHPGNVGAVARAMKTMCLRTLYLVEPVGPLDEEAEARAVGAVELLQQACRVRSLAEALADCRLAIGTSARQRSIRWPLLDPDAGARALVAAADRGPAALVFGREKMGLTNAELDLCQFAVAIPSNPQFPSLNLACAVQVMGYELLCASQQLPAPGETDAREPGVALAAREEVERLYRHLEEVLIQVGYLDPANPRRLMRRLYRLFNRARLDENEVGILRGVLAAVQQDVARRSSPRKPG